MDDFNDIVGSNLKAERTRATYTQDDLGAVLGIGSSMVAAVERGRSSLKLKHAVKICREFNIDISRLVQDVPDESLGGN